MPRALPSRRPTRHRLMLHRPPPRRGRGYQPARVSDLVLALLGVVLLAGFALLAAYALTLGPPGG